MSTLLQTTRARSARSPLLSARHSQAFPSWLSHHDARTAILRCELESFSEGFFFRGHTVRNLHASLLGRIQSPVIERVQNSVAFDQADGRNTLRIDRSVSKTSRKFLDRSAVSEIRGDAVLREADVSRI